MGYGTEDEGSGKRTASDERRTNGRAIRAKLRSSNPSNALLAAGVVVSVASVGIGIGIDIDVDVGVAATCAPRDYADKSFRPVRTVPETDPDYYHAFEA